MRLFRKSEKREIALKTADEAQAAAARLRATLHQAALDEVLRNITPGEKNDSGKQ